MNSTSDGVLIPGLTNPGLMTMYIRHILLAVATTPGMKVSDRPSDRYSLNFVIPERPARATVNATIPRPPSIG
jgi:hypothetical protein